MNWKDWNGKRCASRRLDPGCGRVDNDPCLVLAYRLKSKLTAHTFLFNLMSVKLAELSNYQDQISLKFFKGLDRSSPYLVRVNCKFVPGHWWISPQTPTGAAPWVRTSCPDFRNPPFKERVNHTCQHPVQFFSAIQSYCSRISVELLC